MLERIHKDENVLCQPIKSEHQVHNILSVFHPRAREETHLSSADERNCLGLRIALKFNLMNYGLLDKPALLGDAPTHYPSDGQHPILAFYGSSVLECSLLRSSNITAKL